MRVAGIDCGTNSIRLLIADVDDGRLRDVDRRMEIVRLGEGVDRTGRLSPQALERTFIAAGSYAERIRQSGAQRVRFVATSASRDAENSSDFVAGITEILGVAPEVISGEEEARLSFTGAVRSLPPLPAPALVVDIGGGSTEFVLGDSDETVLASISVDMGCVRMTERHITGDPPIASELQAITTDVDALLEQVRQSVPLEETASLVGLAGTVTTVSALAQDLPSYDAQRIHGSLVGAGEVSRVAAELATASSAQRLALPVMHPGRADVIVAGSLVLDRIVKACGVDEVHVSEHDILDGIVWSQTR